MGESETANDFNGLSYFRITRTERQKKQNHILSLCINKSRGGFTCCSSLALDWRLSRIRSRSRCQRRSRSLGRRCLCVSSSPSQLALGNWASWPIVWQAIQVAKLHAAARFVAFCYCN